MIKRSTRKKNCPSSTLSTTNGVPWSRTRGPPIMCFYTQGQRLDSFGFLTSAWGARDGVVGWGTALQAGRSREALISRIYFWSKTIHVSDSLWAGSGRSGFRPDPARKLYYIRVYHCCVYSEKLLMMDRGIIPKHVEFYSKNKFEKLVHLVGFIIRIYHDARSAERQIRVFFF